jgi:hypothetical protein
MLKINTGGKRFHLEDIFFVFQKSETNQDYHSSGNAIPPMRIPDSRISVPCQYPFKLCLFFVGKDDMTSSTAEVTITIRDVNDEAPTFNQQEYRYLLQPIGSLLAHHQQGCER